MSEPVLLYDTTLRDGTQREGLVLSLSDKLRIARRLDEAGFPYIEGGWPGSNPKDQEFFAAARAMTWRNARIAGREVVYDGEHYFDGFRADPDYALATLRAARAAGATTLVLCDTNGGTLSDGIAAVTRATVDALAADGDGDATRGDGGVLWGIHVHDDAGLAVANSLAAVGQGVRHVQGTVNGYGERCGNANIVTIWANLVLKLGLPTVPRGDLFDLGGLSRFVAEVANIAPDSHAPYVGASAFAHKGGVHGAATMRVRNAYQHVDPALVGNETRLVVSELGGRANAAWLAEQLGHRLDGVVDPRELSALVKRLEAEGASFEGAEASFELLIRRQHPDYRPFFRVVDYTVLVDRRDGGPMRAEASAKVEVEGELLHTAAEGNGPVHAVDQALRKALRAFYPELDHVHLVDYKVRILDGESATAARTRVTIETQGPGGVWATVGSDTNIIGASVQALTDSLEYGLWKADARPSPRGERHFTSPAQATAQELPVEEVA
jgi:2-isopropylmalate synthase